MNAPSWLPRSLRVVSPILILVGMLDPMEGSFLIAIGIVLAAVSAHLDRSRYRKLLLWACALAIVGVASMWILSAFGGFRLPNRPDMVGLSPWYGLLVIPYPLGWIMGVVGVYLRMREARRTPLRA
jgi:hypothetical protein